MSPKEFFTDPKTFLGIIGTFLAYLIGKRKRKVDIDKTEVEIDTEQFELKTNMEAYYDKKIEALTKRINQLESGARELEKGARAKDELILTMQKQMDEQEITIQELKSLLNFNNTINPKKL